MERKRIVISLGGSLLFNEDGSRNREYIREFAEMLVKLKKEIQLAVCVGGGTLARKYAEEARRKTGSEFFADRAAIKATKENAREVIKALGKEGYRKVIENLDDAETALKKNLIPVGAGILEGTTTDFDSMLIAERLGAKELVNMSKIEAVYSEDPRKNPNAKRYEKMTHQQLLELAIRSDMRRAGTNFVFDSVASKLAARSNITVHFVDGRKLEEVEKALAGKKHSGTVVKD